MHCEKREILFSFSNIYYNKFVINLTYQPQHKYLLIFQIFCIKHIFQIFVQEFFKQVSYSLSGKLLDNGLTLFAILADLILKSTHNRVIGCKFLK